MKYPLLSPESADWLEAEYKTSVKAEKDGIHIKNTIDNSTVLPALLREGKLKYIIEVRSPRTMYNKCYSSSDNSIRIDYGDGDLGDAYFVYPLLCAVEKFSLPTEELNEIWRGQTSITIEAGTVIAKHSLWELGESRNSLFRFEEDTTGTIKNDGVLRVEVSGSGSTPFVVYANQNTLDTVKEEIFKNPLSLSIMTGALIGVFAKIAELDTSDKDGDVEENETEEELIGAGLDPRLLDEIYSQLKEKDVPTWEEDNFDPVLAATKLAPFLLSENQLENVGDDEDF